MKTKNLLSLFITAIVCAACTTSPSTVSPSSSVSPSSTVSPSVDPSASVSPSTSPMPSSSTSPSPSVSAPASTTPVTSSCVDLVVGQVYDSSVFNNCPPTVKVGTKWVYSTVAVGTTVDVSAEITGINGNMYTVRTVGPNIDKTTTSTTTYDVKSDAKFTYQGAEDVTVGSGSYPGAFKLTTTQTTSGTTANLTYWVAKNVGVVKVRSESSVSGYSFSVDTTLKSFTR